MAKVKFFGLIGYKDRKGEIHYTTYPPKFTLKLRKHGDRWLVEEHTEENEYK